MLRSLNHLCWLPAGCALGISRQALGTAVRNETALKIRSTKRHRSVAPEGDPDFEQDQRGCKLGCKMKSSCSAESGAEKPAVFVGKPCSAQREKGMRKKGGALCQKPRELKLPAGGYFPEMYFYSFSPDWKVHSS